MLITLLHLIICHLMMYSYCIVVSSVMSSAYTVSSVFRWASHTKVTIIPTKITKPIITLSTPAITYPHRGVGRFISVLIGIVIVWLVDNVSPVQVALGVVFGSAFPLNGVTFGCASSSLQAVGTYSGSVNIASVWFASGLVNTALISDKKIKIINHWI